MAVHFGIEDIAPITVPSEATESLDGFRQWASSEEWDKAKLCFLHGEVWVEMGKEQIFTHSHIKSEFSIVVGGYVRSSKLGYSFVNGILLVNIIADLSCNPDYTFVSHNSFASGRVTLFDGSRKGFTEMHGSPDMVLEVVSDSSEKKDWFRLREGYFDAGIKEYWIVDARGDLTEFQILKRSAKGFVETKRTASWLKSAVFGKSFKLTRGKSPQGLPAFTLDVK